MRCPIIVGSHLQGLARRMVVSIEVIHLVRLLRGTDLYQAIQNLEPVRLTTTPTSIRSDAAAISTTGRQGSVVTATSGSSRLSIRVATLISWVNYMTYWPNLATPWFKSVVLPDKIIAWQNPFPLAWQPPRFLIQPRLGSELRAASLLDILTPRTNRGPPSSWRNLEIEDPMENFLLITMSKLPAMRRLKTHCDV